MNLTIDIGNTRAKIGLFNSLKLIDKYSVATQELISTLKIIVETESKITHAIISSTSNFNDEDLKFLEKKVQVLQLNHKTSVFFNNTYETPNTLGIDRIALAAAAVKNYPSKNVLIIDAGTCITYDFVNDKGDYEGGIISPGLNMRHKAMHDYTANLPLLNINVNNELVGKSTNSSMQIGVFSGTINEIDGFINQYSEKYRDLTVILTGGDAEMLAKRIKNSIFANSNFLLEGLNHILEFNK